MQKILLAGAFALTATAAVAGNLNEPVLEPVITPVIIEEETSSAGNGWLVPVLALLFFGAAAS